MAAQVNHRPDGASSLSNAASAGKNNHVSVGK